MMRDVGMEVSWLMLEPEKDAGHLLRALVCALLGRGRRLLPYAVSLDDSTVAVALMLSAVVAPSERGVAFVVRADEGIWGCASRGVRDAHFKAEKTFQPNPPACV